MLYLFCYMGQLYLFRNPCIIVVSAFCSLIQDYFKHNVVPPLQLACVPVLPGEERPPVERKETLFPHWLKV